MSRLRNQGLAYLRDAEDIAGEYQAAMDRGTWHRAVSHAHEVVEKSLKAAVFLLGDTPVQFHDARVIEKLVEVAEVAVHRFYPARWVGDILRLEKRVEATTTTLAQTQPDLSIGKGRLEIDRDGSTTAVYLHGSLVTATTDTTYSVPIGADAALWRRFTLALTWLAAQRSDARYPKPDGEGGFGFDEHDGLRAGQYMRLAILEVRSFFQTLP